MDARPVRWRSQAVELRRDASGYISSVEGDLVGLLGWSPDEMIGRASATFIHLHDQASAVMRWMEMLDHPSGTHRWRGRYRRADGSWARVETVNTNRLDDPHYGCVVSVMYEIPEGELIVEEQLRDRDELLAQLADALPVGIVQFDTQRLIRFTNHRLHMILGQEDADDVEQLISGIVGDDRERLEEAVSGALAGRSVNEIEVRSKQSDDQRVVCSISLRPLSDMGGTVTGAVATVQDITDRARLRQQLEHQAMVDDLTLCENRRAVLETLRKTLRAMPHAGSGTAVIFADLDDFKLINDRYGHAQGDEVLAMTADRIREALRDVDHVGRLGGDEFLVICPQVTDAEAEEIAERLRRTLHWDLDSQHGLIPVRATIGLAFTATPIPPDDLVAMADSAMYRSKQANRGGSGAARPQRAGS
jgi:diguanylate cyclase (GGDEF)-like protein/PAS domain S-box-containing protein